MNSYRLPVPSRKTVHRPNLVSKSAQPSNHPFQSLDQLPAGMGSRPGTNSTLSQPD